MCVYLKSLHADSLDSLDSLTPLVFIGHCSWQVLLTVSGVLIGQVDIDLCLSANSNVFIRVNARTSFLIFSLLLKH